jgi:hypothetical protein
LGQFELLDSWPTARAITSLSSVEVHGLSWNNPKVIHVEYWLRIVSDLGTSYAVDITRSLSSGASMWLARSAIRAHLILGCAIFNVVTYTNWCWSVHNFFNIRAYGFIIHVWARAVCGPNLARNIQASFCYSWVICAVVDLLLSFYETDRVWIWV